jgi:hypothetical protein
MMLARGLPLKREPAAFLAAAAPAELAHRVVGNKLAGSMERHIAGLFIECDTPRMPNCIEYLDSDHGELHKRAEPPGRCLP